jgi:16S rRNA (uracil1498-N3)-methyltransferase
VQTAPLQTPPDVWLAFAPVRKERTAFVVEKAVELGARRLIPVQTAYTNNADRVRPDKMQAQVIEAAEQCGATYVPQVDGLTKLSALLMQWPEGRKLLFCDENMAGQSHDLGDCPAPVAILIGPQGGFSPDEAAMIRAVPDARGLSLGPRILRAETAALAALALWQARAGDWR